MDRARDSCMLRLERAELDYGQVMMNPRRAESLGCVFEKTKTSSRNHWG